jgi:hypothetical protein
MFEEVACLSFWQLKHLILKHSVRGGSCSDPTIANWAPNRPGVALGTGWREDCVGTVLAFRSEHGNP